MTWKVHRPHRGRPAPSGTAVVSLARPSLEIKAIHFANPALSSTFYYLFNESDADVAGLAPGRLEWWAKGDKIILPEWVAARSEDRNFRACFVRNGQVAMRVKLAASASVPLDGTLKVTPKLDGNPSPLEPVSVSFTYPANAAEHWVDLTLGGALPDEVGRYLLDLALEVRGTGFRFQGPPRARLRIYAIYALPLQPHHDSPADADAGVAVDTANGTLTGTRKRLDHLTFLIGGRNRRHPVATNRDVIDLLWKLHVGINDTPGAPPYFDAGHDEHLTADGTSYGSPLPLEEQWLAWVQTTDPHWNDASCIGHVQLLKTMAASVGLNARRTWILPHTRRLPDGSEAPLADTDLYCLGTYDTSRMQTWTFSHGSRTYVATPKLMEPHQSWENFEACLRSPNGRFLPGGYATSSCPATFRAGKGFGSAKDLLRWWSSTARPGFGRRFMCWVYHHAVTGEGHCWDVNGDHYDLADYVRIRERGTMLPPP